MPPPPPPASYASVNTHMQLSPWCYLYLCDKDECVLRSGRVISNSIVRYTCQPYWNLILLYVAASRCWRMSNTDWEVYSVMFYSK